MEKVKYFDEGAQGVPEDLLHHVYEEEAKTLSGTTELVLRSKQKALKMAYRNFAERPPGEQLAMLGAAPPAPVAPRPGTPAAAGSFPRPRPHTPRDASATPPRPLSRRRRSR